MEVFTVVTGAALGSVMTF